MAKAYPEIQKFKRVELRLREAANAYRSAIEEIDAALATKRTDDEHGLLAAVRAKAVECHGKARDLHHEFFMAVEVAEEGK